MSASNGTCLITGTILTGVSLIFTIHQTWKYDGCRCLVFRRKDWFRALLCWMLIGGNVGLLTFCAGWSYVKYQLGWITIPGYGPMPIPDLMWPEKYRRFNVPLTLTMNIGLIMLISLSAEEGLYWYHLMRAIRQPRLMGSWLHSNFFYSWIAITATTASILLGITWTHRVSFDTQMSRSFITGGVIELIVVAVSTIVIWYFPAFLRDVKDSGAGPEILARLSYYHQANKIRTLFRFAFGLCVLLPSADSLLGRRIYPHPIAMDVLQQISFISYFFVTIISATIYLPRAWSRRPSDTRPRILVGHPDPRTHHMRNKTAEQSQAASFALLSLLREGGRWDYDDDEIQSKATGPQSHIRSSAATPTNANGHGHGDEESGLNGVFGNALVIAPASSVKRSSFLHDWQGPFASAPVGERPIPKELRIMVEQESEVHDDQIKMARVGRRAV